MKARNSERFAALHCRSFSHTLRSWWQQSVRHGATMYQLSRLAAPVWSCESCIGGAFFLGPIISFAPKYLPPCFTKKKQKWLWTRKAIQKDPCTCLCRWGKGQINGDTLQIVTGLCRNFRQNQTIKKGPKIQSSEFLAMVSSKKTWL